MQKLLFFLLPVLGLAIRCPENSVASGDKCYHTIQDANGKSIFAKFSDALRVCEELGGTLAAPKTELEIADVKASPKKSSAERFDGFFGAYGTDFWIGAISPRDSSAFWIDGTDPFKFLRPYTTKTTGVSCLSRSSGKWEFDGCEEQKMVTCKLSPVPECPPGWTYNKDLVQCYKLVNQELDQSVANKVCRLELGELVSIHSDAENAFIGKRLLKPNQQAWIGYVTKKNGNGQDLDKKWTDNSVVNYTDPITDYGISKKRAEVVTTGKTCFFMRKRPDIDGTFDWIPWTCSDKIKAFVCKKKAFVFPPEGVCPEKICPECTTTEKTTTSTTTTTTEPRRTIVVIECPGHFNYSAHYGKCLHLASKTIAEGMTFEENKKKCEELEATMLIFGSEQKDEIGLAEYLLAELDGKYPLTAIGTWLGLKRTTQQDQFKWTDGTSPAYINWKKHTPTTHEGLCASFNIPGQHQETYLAGWNVARCGGRLFGVCQKDGIIKNVIKGRSGVQEE